MEINGHEELIGDEIDMAYDQMRDDKADEKLKNNVAPDEDPHGQRQEDFCN